MPTASGPEGMNEAPGQPWIGKKESLAPHEKGASLKKKKMKSSSPSRWQNRQALPRDLAMRNVEGGMVGLFLSSKFPSLPRPSCSVVSVVSPCVVLSSS